MKGPITYIGVENVEAAVAELVTDGARVLMNPMDVGGGIVLADLFGADKIKGGHGYGYGSTALVLTVFIVGLVAISERDKSQPRSSQNS